jgi:transposase
LPRHRHLDDDSLVLDDIPQSPDEPDDTAMLRAALAAAEVRIAALEQIIKGFQRARFGQSSERVEAGQLALELCRMPVLPEPTNDTPAMPRDRQDPGQRRRNRGALPSHLERIEDVLDLADQGCPCCGVAMRPIGEDRSERLDYAC